MEGIARPGHFRGVATIVSILLNVIRPDFAFFGQKDAQQAVIIKRLARDLAFDTEIIVLPTVREDSGLAMSSRNLYLSEEDQQAATVIHRALTKAKEAFKEGEKNANRLVDLVKSTIESEPRARIDYVNISDAETLEKVDKVEDQPVLIALAVYFGKTRLIDNTILNSTRKKESMAPA
jgi:pantoate--beta-alanine ligase